jgi:hypothetical protein
VALVVARRPRPAEAAGWVVLVCLGGGACPPLGFQFSERGECVCVWGGDGCPVHKYGECALKPPPGGVEPGEVKVLIQLMG